MCKVLHVMVPPPPCLSLDAVSQDIESRYRVINQHDFCFYDLAAAVQKEHCCSVSLRIVRAFWLALRCEDGGTKQALTGGQKSKKGRVQMIQLLKNLHKEESGQDIIEYILVAALITAAVVATITTIGTKVAVLWTNLSNQIP